MRRNLYIMSLDNQDNDSCGLLIIDNKNNTAIIQDIYNTFRCISCQNKENIYKQGDIIMKIMLEH